MEAISQGFKQAVIVIGVVMLGVVPALASAQQSAAPEYTVDPFWPKVPFPNAWLIQGVPFITTDDADHIWAVSRADDMRPDEAMATYSPPRGDCCVPAPEIIEFDSEGNIHNAWGGPGFHPLWPRRPQSVVVDSDFNVWVSAFGQGDGLMKFTREGEFLWDFPHRGPKPGPGEQPLSRGYEDNQETDVLVNGVHNFTLDNEAREIYLTEGKRVLVYDMDNGDFKRGWGGRGMPLSQISDERTPAYDWNGGPPPDQDAFAPALHCIMISNETCACFSSIRWDRTKFGRSCELNLNHWKVCSKSSGSPSGYSVRTRLKFRSAITLSSSSSA